jgi:hypothetical protein
MGLQAVAAQAVADVCITGGERTAPPGPMEQKGPATNTTDLITTTAAVLFTHENHFSRSVRTITNEWTAKQERLYDTLVTREAVGSLSAMEATALDRLQEQRRDTENPASGEEILQQYKRQKLDQGMLELLRRHVRIDPISPNPAHSNATEISYSSPSVS